MSDRQFAEELRKWWSFDDRQVHTHSWHSRENFIENELPKLLARVREEAHKVGFDARDRLRYEQLKSKFEPE